MCTNETTNEYYTTLYNTHYDDLYYFINIMTHCPEETQDIINELYTKLITKKPDLNKTGINTKNYLITSALNLTRDLKRRDKLKRKHIDNLIKDINIGATQILDPITEEYIKNESLNNANKALKNLPQKDHDIFILHAVDKMHITKIAKIHQMTPYKVRMSIRESKDYISKYLKELGYQDQIL